MADVGGNEQGFVEEDVLRLFRGDPMPLPIFLRIAFIPLKTCTALERVIASVRHNH
jgi:hypothetical protein